MAEPPAKRQRLGVANNVVVSVGEGDSKQDFNVPEFFALKSSKFMQTTLGGDWKESHEKRVSLPDTKVSDFEVYLEWLYTNGVITLDPMTDLGATLVRLYPLGHFLIDVRFCNAIIDTLVSYSREPIPEMVFSTAEIDSLWSKTMPESGMRKLLIEFIIRDSSGDLDSPLTEDRGAWSHEVTAEVLARMVESKPVASEIFTALERQAKVGQAMRSTVGHPKDNKNICADYHKHGEDYPRRP